MEGQADTLCCAEKGTASCKDEYILGWGDVCYQSAKWTAYSYTCTNPNPTDSEYEGSTQNSTTTNEYEQYDGNSRSYEHHPGKCMEQGRFDENCCAIKGTASCRDEYELNWLTRTCFDNGQTVAHFFECLPPPEVGDHDSSKCYDNYGPNSYCCAAKRFAYCEDDYIIEFRERCSAVGEEYDFKCFAPETYTGVFVHHPDKCLING